MKKFYFFIAALFAVTQLSAQTPDTVTVIDSPRQVVITETPTGTIVKVKGMKDNDEYNYTYQMEHAANDSIHTSQDVDNDWDINFPFKPKDSKLSIALSGKNNRFTVEMKGIYFGMGLHNDCEMINNSFNWGLLQFAGIQYNILNTQRLGQHFSLGVGYDSKRFSLKRPNCFVQDNNTKVISTDLYPENVDKRSSIINVRAIQFPLMFQQDLNKDFYFTLGGIMNWNVYAKCKTHFKKENTDIDYTYHNIKQNKITFDVLGAINYGAFGIYCRYTPSELFKKGYGPEIKNNVTLGIILAY